MSFFDYFRRFKRDFLRVGRSPKRRNPPVPLVVNYYERLLLPPLAVLVGVLMVVYGHHLPFGYFIRSVDFYKAAVPSIAAAWVVMRLIVRETRHLDGSCPWRRGWVPGPFRRVMLQVYLGVFRPSFFILGVFAVYFLVRGRADLVPRYVKEDLPMVALLLTGFNLLCWAYHQARMDELLGQWKIWTRRMKKDAGYGDVLEAASSVETISYGERMKDTVALYEPSGRGNNISLLVFLDGREEIQLQSLKEIYQAVAGEHFFRLRRELIVNRRAVGAVRETDEGIDVALGPPRSGAVIRVSKRQERAFAAWWERSL